MAITHVNSTANRNAAGNSVTVTAPAGIQDGDLLIAVVANTDTDTARTYPAGFTEIRLDTAIQSSSLNLSMAYKVASGESGNYAFSGTGFDDIAASVTVLRGQATSGFIGDHDIQTAPSGTDTNVVAPSVDPTTAADYLLCVFANSTDETITAPGSMAELVETAGAGPGSFSVCGELLTSASATGTRTATRTAGTTVEASYSLIIVAPSVAIGSHQQRL